MYVAVADWPLVTSLATNWMAPATPPEAILNIQTKPPVGVVVTEVLGEVVSVPDVHESRETVVAELE